jgi:ATPase subunit of ABC transporter with duplicated ATPase domains
MPSLRAERLTFGWAGSEPVVQDADLHLGPGWTALVGRNGAGKTTLLRLLAGALAPTSGRIRLEPAGLRVLACPQDVDAAGPAEAALAAAEDGEARALRHRLRLDPAALARWPTLSPGERRRWQVGAALAAGPAALLLDEPTNHLDAEARALLAAALAGFRGVGLLVSHDRELLEALCGSTVRLEGGAVRHWPLPYGEARRAWEAEAAAAWAARSAAQGAARRAEAALDRARRERAAADAGRSGAGRDRKDRDARSMGAKTVAGWAEAGAGRRVAVRRREAEAARRAIPPPPAALDPAPVLLGWTRCPRPVALALTAPALAAGGRVVLRDVCARLGREARVHLTGANGAGKSTLLSALAGAARADGDRFLHLPQELTAAEAAGLVEEVRRLDRAVLGRVLQLVAALGADPARLLATRAPSPGEARKLLLALGMGRHAWALLLDEPTNHLDLPSVERLEAALAAWPGALLLVTHDQRLAARVTAERWRVEAGRLETAPAGGPAAPHRAGAGRVAGR